MPTGPKGQKRPADVIRNAVKIARIATGEDDDTTPTTARTRPPRRWGARAARPVLSANRADGASVEVTSTPMTTNSPVVHALVFNQSAERPLT